MTNDGLDRTEVPFSDEQREHLLNKLGDFGDVDELIDHQINIIRESDTRSILERLTLAHFFSSLVTHVSERDDMVGLPPALHEYLLGLTIAHGNGDSSNEPDYLELTSNAMDISTSYLLSEQGLLATDQSEEAKLKSDVEFSMLMREVGVGRFMLSEQPFEAAQRAYSPHDAHLKNEFGFTIEEAIECSKYILSIIEKCRHWLIGRDEFILSDIPSDGNTTDTMLDELRSDQQLTIGSDSSDFTRDARLIESYFVKLSEYHHTLSLTEGVLLNHLPDTLSEQPFREFLTRMSQTIPANREHSSDFRYPFQFNPLHKHPILKCEGRYFVPSPDALQRALMETFYYDLIELEGYGDPSGETGGEFGNVYGDYLENWAYDCFTSAFSEADVLLNPVYPKEGYPEACDVLVFADDLLLVVECKTGKLPLSTRRGSFESIQRAVQSKVGEGYRQCLELIRNIEDKSGELIHDGERVNIEKRLNYQPVVVVGEPYDSISTYLMDVVLDIEAEFPYVVDIFHLQMLSETLTDRRIFTKYINDRIALFEEKILLSSDEADYLGIFIRNGYEFPEAMENTAIVMNDMSDIVARRANYEFGQ